MEVLRRHRGRESQQRAADSGVIRVSGRGGIIRSLGIHGNRLRRRIGQTHRKIEVRRPAVTFIDRNVVYRDRRLAVVIMNR